MSNDGESDPGMVKARSLIRHEPDFQDTVLNFSRNSRARRYPSEVGSSIFVEQSEWYRGKNLRLYYRDGDFFV